ncbi:MAG: flippase-like domain-containing protein [Actinomycetia bacterium]|nr:flippase-like domain-containing protein [Actinomycetes bacterium]
MSTPRRLGWWLLNVVLPLVVLVLLAVFVWNRREQFQAIGEAPLLTVVLLALLTAAGFSINAAEFGILYRVLGAPVGALENQCVFVAGQLGNHIPGQVGTLYRFRYMKSVYGLTYTNGVAVYSVNLVLTALATGAIGLVGCLGLWLNEGTWSLVLTGALLALVVVALGAASISPTSKARQGRIGRLVTRFSSGWATASGDRKAAAAVVGLELLRFVLLAVRLKIAFAWVGIDESVMFFLIVGPVGSLATFVSFTPSGIGIRELVMAGATAALGRSLEDGLLASSVDRGINLLVVLLLGIPAAVATARWLHRAEAESTAETGSSAGEPSGSHQSLGSDLE